MQSKPKRRWLRYSIRMLLVAVTIVCVWLAWQLHQVRERRALIKRIQADGDGGYVSLLEVEEEADGRP